MNLTKTVDELPHEQYLISDLSERFKVMTLYLIIFINDLKTLTI